MNERMLFLNIGWMKRYHGKKDGDRPEGGGKKQIGFGHEMFNFQPFDGKMFGFVESKRLGSSPKRNSLHIEKIDKSCANKDQISDILVIWTATNPKAKGTFIVGWYKNATVYRNEQHDIERECGDGEKFGYFVTADREDCFLLPEDERTKEVFRVTTKGAGWLGQSNIWYANHPNVASFRQKVLDYVKKY